MLWPEILLFKKLQLITFVGRLTINFYYIERRKNMAFYKDYLKRGSQPNGESYLIFLQLNNIY